MCVRTVATFERFQSSEHSEREHEKNVDQRKRTREKSISHPRDVSIYVKVNKIEKADTEGETVLLTSLVDE